MAGLGLEGNGVKPEVALGIELDREGREIVRMCLEKGLIINCTMDRVLRLLPPLIIKEGDLDRALEILFETIRGFQG